jgi:hypothetical protein
MAHKKEKKEEKHHKKEHITMHDREMDKKNLMKGKKHKK